MKHWAISVLAGVCGNALLASVAQAQGLAPPPVRSVVDENGVDMLSGLLRVSTPSITIGQPGMGGLSFVRTFDSSNSGGQDGWRDNLTGGINLDSNVYTVTLFGSSMRFALNAGVFSSAENPGWTMTLSGNIYTLTATDGTVAQFDTTKAGTLPTLANTARVSQVRYPSGEVVTFTYTSLVNGSTPYAQRLQSVNNNLGYQIKLEYQTSNADASGITMVKATGINNANDYCSPTANTCTLTGVWPSLTFASPNAATQTVTDSLSRVWTYTLSASGAGSDVVGIRRPTSATDNVTIAYTSGKVASVNDGTSTWTYSFSDSGDERIASNNGPLGVTQVVQSQLSTGVVLLDNDALNRAVTYEYFPTTNWLKKVTAPEGNAIEYTYDARGNVTQTRAIAKAGSGLADIVTSASYSASCANATICNQPNSVTDARGFVTDFTYDSGHGGVLTATAPAPSTGAVRPQTRYTYQSLSAYYKNSAGTIVVAPSPVTRLTLESSCATLTTCAGGADETRMTYAYGSTGVANNRLPVSVTAAAGNNAVSSVTAMTYDRNGDVLTINGPLSGTTDTSRIRYDNMRQVVGAIGPDPDGGGALKHRAQRFIYNNDGQVTSTQQGTVNSQSDTDWANFAILTQVDTAYDTMARPIKEEVKGGATTYSVSQYSYDAVSRLDCAALRMNSGVYGSLPSSACSLSTQGAAGPDRIVKYGYDNANQVLTVVNGFGTALAQTTATNTYSNNGQPTTIRNAEGSLTTFTYDGFDRPLQLIYPDPNAAGTGSNAADYEQYTYDTASNVTSYRLRDGTSVAITYDNLGRPTFTDAPGATPDVTRAYDNFGRITSISQPGQTYTMAYDQLSRMLSQTGPLGAVAYQYDSAGRRTRLTYPGGFYVTYVYNVANDVTNIRENGATTTTAAIATIAYNDVGARTSLTRPSSSVVTSYAYDTLFRPSGQTLNLSGTAQDQTLGFAYNPSSQLTSRTSSNAAYAFAPVNQAQTYAVNGVDQYTSVAGAAFAYDTRGNLTSDGAKTYGYDAFNRLTTGSNNAVLSYDPLGRLFSTSANGSAETRFLYDGADLIAEYNSSGVLLRRFVHGPAIDEPLAWYEGTGTTDRRWLVGDQLGSIVAITNASGAMLSINTYDEFGKPGASNSGRFQYTGQAWLPELSLYHYKARAYAPGIGRFLQTDPVGMAGGVNLYAYVGNDPVNTFDPWGLRGSPNVDGGGGDDQPLPPAPIQPPIPQGEIIVNPPGISGNIAALVNSPAGRTGFLDLAFPGLVKVDGFNLGLSSDEENEEIVVTPSPAGIEAFRIQGFRYKNDVRFLQQFIGLTFANGQMGLPLGPLGQFGKGAIGAIGRACGCFVAGTMVATPDGLRPIEDLKVGDLVLAYDEATGQVEPKPITALLRPAPKAVLDLSFRDEAGEVVRFTATADHPWLVAQPAGVTRWADTLELKPGDQLITEDGDRLIVARLALRPDLAQTYNLEVVDLHTFLVGEDGVVVHNGCPLLDAVQNLRNIETIARGNGIRNLQQLIKKYGGPARQWRKLKGAGELNGRTVEVHWYQNNSVGRFEGRIKEGGSW